VTIVVLEIRTRGVVVLKAGELTVCFVFDQPTACRYIVLAGFGLGLGDGVGLAFLGLAALVVAL
jgi:hypothetical protein